VRGGGPTLVVAVPGFVFPGGTERSPSPGVGGDVERAGRTEAV
jgi:hypothetical protein